MEICNERTEIKLNNYSKRPEGYAVSNDSIFQNEISLDASVIIPFYNSEAYLSSRISIFSLFGALSKLYKISDAQFSGDFANGIK